MKKQILVVLGILFYCASVYCQDTLVYMDGTTMEVKVIDMNEDYIGFNLRADGPSFDVSTKQIFMVRMESGEKVVIDHTVEEEEPIMGYDRFQYNGPKVGLTMLGEGQSANFLEKRGYLTPLVTQFGWQFETRLFTLDNQLSGLLEWIVLVGGVEKGLFLPSASMIFGLREGKRGFEFGLGPNLSLTGFGMAFAAGGSFQSGRINIPVNVAFIPSLNKNSIFDGDDTFRPTGFRLSLLVGFNTRVR